MAACVLVTALIAALWFLSSIRCFALNHARGSVARNTQTPDGQMGAWEFTMTTRSVQTGPHWLRLVRAEYLSIMSTESEKNRFDSQLGWKATSFPRSGIRNDWYPWVDLADMTRGRWRFLGLGPGLMVGGAQTARMFDIPYWLPMVVLATPVLFAIVRQRRQARRAREGGCLKCGYPLGPEMIRCPECGSER
ncbi:MAG: hypothetical protein KF699_09315 [Phycisphaeraceae bacterium]|nr:hypothetical protein [Phycisphaeraceae bacterium]MBX3406379.1 hypothetical protein [Phycisphaeraceae bacterium]